MRISDWSSDVCSSDLKEPVGVYMVMAEEENMTVIRSPLIAAGLDVLRFDLRYLDRSVTLEEPMPEFVLSRQAICDLVIDSSYASRRHATIPAVRGKVFLKDHSQIGRAHV